MLSKQLISEIQQLIAKGKTGDALSKISKVENIAEDAHLHKYLILLQSQWSKYKSDKVDNIKSDILLDRELNRINKSILSFIKGDVESIPINDTPTKRIPMRALALAAVLLIAIAGFFFWKNDQNSFEGKELLESYKIDVLDAEGHSQEVLVAKIYKDFTGQLIRNGKAKKMESVQQAGEAFLMFSVKEDQELLEYSGMKSLGEQFLRGNVMQDGQILRKWIGKEIE
ncbi:MAG: hypothetical protein AAFP82_19410 [Bacteroidota bacterium]